MTKKAEFFSCFLLFVVHQFISEVFLDHLLYLRSLFLVLNSQDLLNLSNLWHPTDGMLLKSSFCSFSDIAVLINVHSFSVVWLVWFNFFDKPCMSKHVMDWCVRLRYDLSVR